MNANTQTGNMESSNKFSMRTNVKDAELIRVAYSEYRARRQLIDPSKTAPSMNGFLKEAVLRFIEGLYEK
jgi:hypothetical protein